VSVIILGSLILLSSGMLCHVFCWIRIDIAEDLADFIIVVDEDRGSRIFQNVCMLLPDNIPENILVSEV
jgi:hypothetical protein